MKSKGLLPALKKRIARQMPVVVSAVAVLPLPKPALILGAQYGTTLQSKMDAHTITTASKQSTIITMYIR